MLKYEALFIKMINEFEFSKLIHVQQEVALQQASSSLFLFQYTAFSEQVFQQRGCRNTSFLGTSHK